MKLKTTLNERYRLDKEIGQGGMGTVYRAHDSVLDRDVAVKLMSNAKLGTEGRTRLLHEAKVVAKLNHPNIVSVFDAGEIEENSFIVMELVAGESLHDKPPKKLEEIIEIACQVCAALEHAHKNGVVHRDLKPENVILDGGGVAKLMDFGIARSVASRLTSEGTVIGTVFYMAPEQAMGGEIDARTDLYALGVMLYELTTGELPYLDEEAVAVISQHIHAPVIPPRAKNDNIPPGLDALIVRLMSKEADDRPAAAEEVSKILGAPDLLDTSAEPNEELSVLDRIVRGRIVGRRDQFEEARDLWRKVPGGEGQLLLISGEPGIGKTRLMREIVTHAEVTGGRILLGECYAEGGPPYYPFAQIIREIFEKTTPKDLGVADFVLADLLTITPDLRQRYTDFPPNPKLGAKAEQQRLVENMVTFLGLLSSHSSMLVVIEDVHWADSGSLFMLRHLARRMQNQKVMLLFTYREIEIREAQPFHEMVLEFDHQRLATRIKLGRLDREQTRTLLAAIFAEEISDEFSESIYHETEGNPFFIEEVCKALVDSGELYYEDGEWRRPDVDKLEIPQSVRVAIESRLHKLPDEVAEILLAAAVLGREFDYETLAKSTEGEEDLLISALETAEQTQLLREISGKRGGIFAFSHALIPAALYEGASGLRRRRMHHQALAAVETLRPTDYAALARHAVESGDVDRGLIYSIQAGDEAAGLYAHEQALGHYTHAQEAAEELKNQDEIIEIIEKRGDVVSATGALVKANEIYEDALRLKPPSEKSAEINKKIGYNYIYVGDVRALDFLEAAQRELNPKTQIDILASTKTNQGRYQHLIGQHAKAVALIEEAHELAEPLKEKPLFTLLEIYAYLAGAYQHLAELETSNHWAKQCIILGEQNNYPLATGVGHEYISENANILGNWSEAIEQSRLAHQIGEKIGEQGRQLWAGFNDAWAYHGRGDLLEGANFARATLESAQALGDARLAVLSGYLLAINLTDLGDPEAEAIAKLSVEGGNQLNQIFMLCMSRLGLTYYYNHREKWKVSNQLMEESFEFLKGTDSLWARIALWPVYAEALWGLGRFAEAEKICTKAVTASRKADAKQYLGRTLRVEAMVNASQKRWELAGKKIAEAIKIFDKIGSQLELGRAYQTQAEILNGQGEDGKAMKSLDKAIELFEACGAKVDLKRARKLAKNKKK